MSKSETETVIWSSEFTAYVGDFRSELTTIKDVTEGKNQIDRVSFDSQVEPLKIYRKPLCIDEPEWVVCIHHVSNNDPSRYSMKTIKK
ncbi:unnamed protein product, partial [Mesorhabditis belari]|uniref:Uncharacterized protein n=1 Tax=Mesorhabditis belari TaxID=2138241 RepID=A0AAF3FQW0_9BILA